MGESAGREREDVRNKGGTEKQRKEKDQRIHFTEEYKTTAVVPVIHLASAY